MVRGPRRKKRRPSAWLAVAAWVALASAGRPALAAEAKVGGAPASHALDGKTFVGQTGEQGKDGSEADTFTFANGEFHSLASDRHGFGPAPYVTVTDGDTTRAVSQTRSDTEGNMSWKLAIRGDSLEGSATWWKGSRKVTDYWVRGTLQK